jgi:hypothetical protein
MDTNEKTEMSDNLVSELGQHPRWAELERWISEHNDLCQLCNSLSFSQQKASENYRLLILNSAKFGLNLIRSMRQEVEPTSFDSNRSQSEEKDGSMNKIQSVSLLGQNSLGIGIAGSERVGSMIKTIRVALHWFRLHFPIQMVTTGLVNIQLLLPILLLTYQAKPICDVLKRAKVQFKNDFFTFLSFDRERNTVL